MIEESNVEREYLRKEQEILLQNHGNCTAQGIQIVLPYVLAAYLNATLGNIVKAGDKLNESGLG